MYRHIHIYIYIHECVIHGMRLMWICHDMHGCVMDVVCCSVLQCAALLDFRNDSDDDMF